MENTEGLNVLSLFDGISCGQVALQRAGVKVKNYFASEIDKHAIKITQHNWPRTKQLGDVNNIDLNSLPQIDLIIAGSPCQSFSNCGDGSGFDGKSGLFWKFAEILKKLKAENDNLVFFLENVVMKKEWEDVISKELNCEPYRINSKIICAQSRPRLYWTNLKKPNLEDKNVCLKDILDENVSERYLLSEKAIAYLNRAPMNRRFEKFTDSEKSGCVTANFCKGVPYNVLTNMVTGVSRRFTPEECEKLQTLPIKYTKSVSDTQRYKAIGNGWTVDVIAHIFQGLNKTQNSD